MKTYLWIKNADSLIIISINVHNISWKFSSFEQLLIGHLTESNFCYSFLFSVTNEFEKFFCIKKRNCFCWEQKIRNRSWRHIRKPTVYHNIPSNLSQYNCTQDNKQLAASIMLFAHTNLVHVVEFGTSILKAVDQVSWILYTLRI